MVLICIADSPVDTINIYVSAKSCTQQIHNLCDAEASDAVADNYDLYEVLVGLVIVLGLLDFCN